MHFVDICSSAGNEEVKSSKKQKVEEQSSKAGSSKLRNKGTVSHFLHIFLLFQTFCCFSVSMDKKKEKMHKLPEYFNRCFLLSTVVKLD